jgi:GntR family transcriptional regulator/MocR family aminotransferase
MALCAGYLLRYLADEGDLRLVCNRCCYLANINYTQGRRPAVAAHLEARLIAGRRTEYRKAVAPQLLRWAERLRRADWPFVEGPLRSLAPAHADARLFPHEIWARCLRRAARRATQDTPAIIILPSAEAALELTARLLLDKGDIAWVESPGYGGARAAMEAAGADVRGVMLDHNGLSVRGRRDRPRLIFVKASHQHPTGRLMSIAGRRELLRFAADAGASVIEDDDDSEIHYEGLTSC